jgi:NADH:ubiquinone oxidoreductase subunit F (NADH-binding)
VVTEVRAPVQGVLAAAASSYGQHLRLLGPLPELPAERIRRLVQDSGLTGRGGAGFPTGRKLAAVAGHRRAVVVANGAEGEPASSKDRMLLLRAPHLVLDGVALAVRATGATEAYLYAPDDLVDWLLGIARQRRDPVAVSLIRAPDRFIAGQETAAIAAIEGRPALPRSTPPMPFAGGVRGRPTLVQNVETLAQLGLIVRYGPAWFRAIGTTEEPGTRLLTVSGAVFRPGVYEAAAGDTLGAALRLAGGTAGPVQAVLVGGYHGGWVPWLPDTAGVPLTRTALNPYDAAPGAGVLVALPRRRCGLAASAEIVAYLAGQNAGQCGPCRNGLPVLAGHLRELATGWPTRALVREIRRLVGLVDGRGACAHPTGTARLVRSTLRVFDPDVGLHLAGRCAARTGTR